MGINTAYDYFIKVNLNQLADISSECAGLRDIISGRKDTVDSLIGHISKIGYGNCEDIANSCKVPRGKLEWAEQRFTRLSTSILDARNTYVALEETIANEGGVNFIYHENIFTATYLDPQHIRDMSFGIILGSPFLIYNAGKDIYNDTLGSDLSKTLYSNYTKMEDENGNNVYLSETDFLSGDASAQSALVIEVSLGSDGEFECFAGVKNTASMSGSLYSQETTIGDPNCGQYYESNIGVGNVSVYTEHAVNCFNGENKYEVGFDANIISGGESYTVDDETVSTGVSIGGVSGSAEYSTLTGPDAKLEVYRAKGDINYQKELDAVATMDVNLSASVSPNGVPTVKGSFTVTVPLVGTEGDELINQMVTQYTEMIKQQMAVEGITT